MYPFTISFQWADSCTPDNNIPGVILRDTEDEFQATINNRDGLFNLIQDVTKRINAEIQAYKDRGTNPHDDATSDIENALDLLTALNQHIWD